MAHKILIVEDNEDNRELIIKVLGRDKYEILEAESGEDALKVAKRELPDLILMDIGLKGMNGFDATRELKRNKALKDVPVVALTAYAMVGDRERAIEAGCDDYMSKPINVREFPLRIAQLIGEKSVD